MLFLGLSESELHKYVVYDADAKKGPKRINLDDDKLNNKYEPPTSLAVHLSKIPIPELQPKPYVDPKKAKMEEKGKGKGKDKKRERSTLTVLKNTF